MASYLSFVVRGRGLNHRGGGVVQLKVVGSYHHAGGTQGVAGTFEVVPLDAIKLPDVVAASVVHTVQVGESAGIKPPT